MSLKKNKKTIVICNFPRFSDQIWMPFLWAQAKTYYEIHGQRTDEWEWFPCYADVYSAEYEEKITEIFDEVEPTIFAISLYVWNFNLAHKIANWVKKRWPNCLIISGGPHQYLKHDINWFRQYPYLDASLPGDCYGELCFKEILDSYDENTNTVDWDQVTDIFYPSQSRFSVVSKKTMSRQEKKNYAFDWSAFDRQLEHLAKFVDFQRREFPKSILLSVLETTRGCPYGCTYCDWGGGTSTTVVQKSLTTVKKEIDALMQFGITYLFLADANFGIFGERDVKIIQYLADRKNATGNRFGIGYGGFAKTDNRLDHIKQILYTDMDNNLSLHRELKISMQSLDNVVLENIDRKNIDLDKQLEVYQRLSIGRKIPLYVEMILGLPGITLEKFYHELNVLGKRDLNVVWYEWILLPETPAFASDYRRKYGIKTTLKRKGWAVREESSEREVVTVCSSYSDLDYLQMLLSTSLYHLIHHGGWYSDTIDNILQTSGIGIGDLCKDIYENYVMSHHDHDLMKTSILQEWRKIQNDPLTPCEFVIDGHYVYGGWYFVAKCFLSPKFSNDLINWLVVRYSIDRTIPLQEKNLQINYKNLGKNYTRFAHIFDYKKEIPVGGNDLDGIIGAFRHYVDSGRLMRGKKKLLGLITIQD